jgi:AraC-like DNA-binding protein
MNKLLYFYGMKKTKRQNFAEMEITPQNWNKYVTGKANVFTVNDDLFLVEDLHLLPKFDFPFKVNMTVVSICTQGVMRSRADFKLHESKAPCINVFWQNQTLQQEYLSDDYQGYAIVMSPQFTNKLRHEIHHQTDIPFHFDDNRSIPLTGEELKIFVSYYNSIKMIAGLNNYPYQIETLWHITMAFFYISNYYNNFLPEKTTTSPQDILVNKFMKLVKENFKHERQMSFYADKLSLTPKYLSLKIREVTGKSATDWIDDYVILEAKALLKSTNMTVQQISDELNFSSQSFFGRYFKRNVGMSPKEYKGK